MVYVIMDVRLNVRRLLLSLLSTFVLPMLFAIFVDFQVGMFPWLTIIASLVFIPLSTFVVIRAALSEMDRLIEEIAPEESEPENAEPEEAELVNTTSAQPESAQIEPTTSDAAEQKLK